MSDEDPNNPGKGMDPNDPRMDELLKKALSTLKYFGAGKLPPISKKFKFPFTKFHDLKASTKSRFLVKDVIPDEGIFTVWGPQKCGKSFSMFDLAMHIALGWRWHGKRVRQGAVAYCAFEGGGGYPDRKEAWCRTHLNDRLPQVDDWVWVTRGGKRIQGRPTKVIEMHETDEAFAPEYTVLGLIERVPRRELTMAPEHIPMYVMTQLAKLVTDHAALIESIEIQMDDNLPVAIFLDTLNRSLEGSENDDEDMRAYVDAAEALAKIFGCIVIIVHHSGIDATRSRGHTSLPGAVVGEIKVGRDAAKRVVLTLVHSRDAAEGQTFVSDLQVVPLGMDDDGDLKTSCAIVQLPGLQPAPETELPRDARTALDLLRELIERDGKEHKRHARIPSHVKTVTVTAWREEFYGRSTAEQEESKRKAFQRVSNRLRAKPKPLIEVWDGYVWLVAQGGTSMTDEEAEVVSVFDDPPQKAKSKSRAAPGKHAAKQREYRARKKASREG